MRGIIDASVGCSLIESSSLTALSKVLVEAFSSPLSLELDSVLYLEIDL